MKTVSWFTMVGGALITIAVGLGAWNLSKTASIPEVYATKVEVKDKADAVKEDAEKDRQQIRRQIKDGFDKITREQQYVRETIDELNRYLRDRANNDR